MQLQKIIFILATICLISTVSASNWTFPNASAYNAQTVDIVNSTYTQDWMYYLMVTNNSGSIWEFPILGFAGSTMGPFADSFEGMGAVGIVYLVLWGLFIMMVWRQSGKITIPALIASVTAGAWGLLMPESAQPWCLILLAAALASQLFTFFAKE
jgi:hypothetical protein